MPTTGVIADGTHDSFNSYGAVTNVGFAQNQLLVGTSAKGAITTALYYKYTGLSLPADSDILSAIITFTASSLGPNPLTLDFRVAKRSGVWDASSYTGWRPLTGYDLFLELSASGPTVLATTGVVVTEGFDHKLYSSPARHQQHAQSVKATQSGTLTGGKVYLRRFGNPSGSAYLEIYSVADVATGLPATLLATSDYKDCSTIPTSMSAVSFVFSGANQIAITSGTTYVGVFRSTFTANDNDQLRIGARPLWPNGPYADGLANVYGEGSGFDDQNYPTDLVTFNELWDDPFSATKVLWDAPEFFAWNSYPTPNLKTIVQEFVNDSSYVNDGTLGLMVLPVGAVAGNYRAVQSHDWGGQQTPLQIIYRPVGCHKTTVDLASNGKSIASLAGNGACVAEHANGRCLASANSGECEAVLSSDGRGTAEIRCTWS